MVPHFSCGPRAGCRGQYITLRFPSVGASETLLMAAVCAKGMTVLRGAATEPEVQDLAHFLCKAGASIEGIGTRTLRVMGRPQLGGARHTVCADRIVASTALCAVAACGGDICLVGENGTHIAALLHILRRMGCDVCRTPGGLLMARQGRLCAPGALYTDVYPALATDAAPLLAAAFLKSEGFSAVTDTVFENRFACAEGFSAMGGNVKVSGRTLLAKGRRRLHAADVAAPDLRGGAALCIAALCAEMGKAPSARHISIARGYEDMAALLNGMGARPNGVKKRPRRWRQTPECSPKGGQRRAQTQHQERRHAHGTAKTAPKASISAGRANRPSACRSARYTVRNTRRRTRGERRQPAWITAAFPPSLPGEKNRRQRRL